MKVTIKDVAKEANVAVSTVSRVISNNSRISVKTKLKVWDAIKKLNYTPIPYAPMNNFYPIIQAGKFFKKDDRKIMPLSITVHHAVADGYHVGLFLEKFQEYMDFPEKWMK